MSNTAGTNRNTEEGAFDATTTLLHIHRHHPKTYGMVIDFDPPRTVILHTAAHAHDVGYLAHVRVEFVDGSLDESTVVTLAMSILRPRTAKLHTVRIAAVTYSTYSRSHH